MSNDSNLEEEIVTRLRRAVADAERRGYDRGVHETMAKIQSFVMPPQNITTYGREEPQHRATPNDNNSVGDDEDTSVEGRKRAPKGLVRTVVKRAIAQTPGLTASQIQETVQNELERMIQASSFRSELRKGREVGLYRENNGKWFLVETEKAEDSRSSIPSAFSITTERG